MDNRKTPIMTNQDANQSLTFTPDGNGNVKAPIPPECLSISEVLASVLTALRGIDKTLHADDEGWWETLEGAEFGAEVIRKVYAAFGQHKP